MTAAYIGSFILVVALYAQSSSGLSTAGPPRPRPIRHHPGGTGSGSERRSTTILDGLPKKKQALVVLAPQFGDFDSAEYAEQLGAVAKDLAAADIALRFVGIGAPVRGGVSQLSMDLQKIQSSG